MITKTYMIPEENVENLEKKFNAAARKIRKISPELEPTMTKSNHTIVLVRKIEFRPCDCRHKGGTGRATCTRPAVAFRKETEVRPSRLPFCHRHLLDVYVQHRNSGDDAHLPGSGAQNPAS